ncbi:ATP-binding protein [Streptomyces sp. NPDC005529]|uniref:ATP-binding protein n=2 Tax=Streptomyces TaxID=1883 RepID=UPI0033B4AE86
MFVGREAELTALTQSAVQAGQGVPGVVVVEGESGIGKTALVRQALNRLEGFTVWWAACVPEEQDWAFGALQQWLRRVDRAALADFEVLGQPLGPRAAPSAVGAELVELMDAVQADGPVALVLDDVQWADEESLRALRFLVRRLFADRILLVVTARTSSARTGQGHVPGHEWRRLESDSAHTQVVRLSGLDEGEVSLLAGARHRSASGVMHRLWQHTGGHPLHLLSLMGTVPAADLADPRRPLPVPVSLSAAVGQNLAALPADSRALCEALAVLDMRVPLAVAGQVAQVEDAVQALGPLLDSGLIEWAPEEPSTPMHLTHPLQQEAIYQALQPSHRRALHGACVPLVSKDAAWRHRVAACDQTDPALAGELEEEARCQAEAGKAARAATLLLWASDLSVTREQYEDRMLSAATHLSDTTHIGLVMALQLRDRVEQCAPCARRTYLQSCYAFADSNFPLAVELGDRALIEAEAKNDQVTRAMTIIRLGIATFHAGDRKRAADLMWQADRDCQGSSPMVKWLLSIALMCGDGPRVALEEPWLAALPEDPRDTPQADTVLLINRGYCRMATGQMREAAADFAVPVMPSRSAATSPQALLHSYVHQAICQYYLGDWQRAAVQADLAITEAELAVFRNQLGLSHGWAAIIAAGQGRWDNAREHCQAITDAGPPLPVYADAAGLAEAAIAQAQGDGDAMHRALRPVLACVRSSVPTWPTHMFWPMWTEALTETGQLEEAHTALTTLQAVSHEVALLRTVTAHATGRLAEAHGDTAGATAAYDTILSQPATPEAPPLHRARLEHAAARLHLHLNNRTRARDLTSTAQKRLQKMGAAPFLSQLQPLTTIDSTAAPQHEPIPQLTEREQDVARYAAQGLTNREIAQQLFVSAKTVEYHLGNIFTKLDLTSRRQLRNALDGRVPQSARN